MLSLVSPLGSVPQRPALYQRLRDLVYSSQYIDPNYVLAKLPKVRERSTR